MRSIPSAAIAKIADTIGVYRGEREAEGFGATCVRVEHLTVQAREDVTQSHTMSADEASKQQVFSGGPRVSVMQTTNLGYSDDTAATRCLDLSRNRRVSIE